MTNFVSSFMPVCILTAFTNSLTIQRDSGHSWTKDINQRAERSLKNAKPVSHINIILHSQVTSSMTESILNAYKTSHPLILSESGEKAACCCHSKCYKMHHIVGIFNAPEQVRPDQWKALYGPSWDSAAFTIIWITSLIDLQDIETLLVNFWHQSSLNVVVIIFDSSKKTTRAYGYDPFVLKNDKTRGRIFQVPVEPSATTTTTLFPDKLKNLHGHSIPISLYDHRPHTWLHNFTELLDGTDVNYCLFLAYRMNFTIALKTARVDYSSYMVKLPNGSVVGALGDLVTKRSEFIGNSLQWDSPIALSLDVVYPRWRSKVVVLVPRESPIPGIFLLFRANSGFTLLIIGSMLCFLMVCLAIKGDNNVVLKTLGLLLFQTFGKIGHRSSERLFCISWIYWSFILVTIFQGTLVHDLGAPPFYNDIDTIQELLHSNLTLSVRAWEQDILNKSFINNRRKLANKSIVNMNSTNCLVKMHLFRNIACSIDENYAEYTIGEVQKAIYKRQGAKRSKVALDVHIIKEPLIYFWRTFVVRKGFPYLAKMNEAASRLVEFGIMRKWVIDDLSKSFRVTSTENEIESIKLENFDKVFILLLYGHTIATIVFVIEITFHKYKCRISWPIKM